MNTSISQLITMPKDYVESEPNSNGIGLFDKTEKYVSINPLSRDYQIIDLQPEEVKYLKSLIDSLEKNESIIMCARGDSLQQKEFDSFMRKKINDFFIVGSKGKLFRSQPDSDSYCNVNTGNLISDIEELITKANSELREKSESSETVSGRFPDDFVSQIQESEGLLQTWKLILLAFLHNKGKDNYFKPFSGLLSVTYGENKYDKAYEFAIGRRKNGFVFVYILNKDSKKYITAEELQQMLARYGIKWYDDVHKEIMIQNGLFPHYIIGFFEIRDKITKSFVLNPWFHLQMQNDLKFNYEYEYKNGVSVDQTTFHTSLKNFDYNAFFIHDHVSGKDLIISENKMKPNLEKDEIK
ncbi:MAG: hypothetical protein PWQ50_48 [Methanolobus sp.]|jgi:hypothetical protein|nr:hypothetical protein [Methanolobus sp.]